MALFPLKRKWVRKPNHPVKIDWSNPLNKGLAHFWPMWEQGGTTAVRDIVGGAHGSHNAANPPNVIASEEGFVLNAPSGDLGQVDMTSAPTYNGNFSVEFLFRRHSGTGFGLITGAGGVQGFFTSGGNIVYYDQGASRAASAITDNEWTHVVCTFKPNAGAPANEDIQMHVNGKAAGSFSNSDTAFTPNYFMGHGSEYLIGDIAYVKIYNVTKTEAEAKALYQNTWQSFEPITQYINTEVSIDISGTLNTTDENDSIVANGVEIISGTLNTTDVNDTISASGNEIFTGTLNTTDNNDTITANGIHTDQWFAITSMNVLGLPMGEQTFEDKPTTGILDVTDVDDSITSNGESIYVGTLDVTDVDDSIISNGTISVDISGTLNTSDNDDTIAGSGIHTGQWFAITSMNVLGLPMGEQTFEDKPVEITSMNVLGLPMGAQTFEDKPTTGTLDIIDENDTIVADGVMLIEYTGTLNVTDVDDSIISNGKSTYAGTLVETDVDDTIIANGYMNISGTSDIIEENDSIEASGLMHTSGTLDVTEEDDSTTTSGESTYIGTLDVTEEDDSATASGKTGIEGALDIIDENDSVTASGETFETHTGTLNVTDVNDSITANGETFEARIGTLDVTEEDDSTTTSGESIYVGTLNVTDIDDSINTSGESIYAGTLDVTDVNDSISANGIEIISGISDITEEDDSIISNGIEIIFGISDITEEDDSTTTSGESIYTGTLVETEEDDSTTTSGESIYVGTLNVTDVDDSIISNGKSTYAGTLVETDVDDSVSASGIIAEDIYGTLNTTDNDDTSVIFGVYPIDGSVVVLDQNDVLVSKNGIVTPLPFDKTQGQTSRSLHTKTVEKFYVSFFEMSENISNILGREVMSIERPNLTFNEYSIYNKGKRWTNGSRIEYQPLTITFYDDDKSLVNNAIITQLRKQTNEIDNDGSRFSINTRLYAYNSVIAEEFTLQNCFIQSVTQSESSYQDATISTITVTITYNKLDYTFPKLDVV